MPSNTRTQRRTIVVPDRLAYRLTRFSLASRGERFVHVVTLPSITAQLAGGFISAASSLDMLVALRAAPLPALEAFENVSTLPGFARSAVQSVQTLWGSNTAEHDYPDSARYRDVWRIAQHIREHLRPGIMPIPDVVDEALARVAFAKTLLGSVDLVRVGSIPDVYRPLFTALADVVPLSWHAPFAERPTWWTASAAFSHDEFTSPDVSTVECASPTHEVTEALRWARQLIVSGVSPSNIAIAAADVTPYESTVRAMLTDLDFPIHIANGTLALTHRHGQRAAALAAAWTNPDDANTRAFVTQQFEGQAEHILEIAKQAPRTSTAGRALGREVLRDTARSLWLRALDEAPPHLITTTLKRARTDDRTEPTHSVVLCNASQLAGSPRKHVRLLGVNANTWPRKSGIDPLLPHTFAAGGPTATEQDELDFHTILRGAERAVLSCNRRNGDGQILTRSRLLDPFPEPVEIPLIPTAAHAVTEADRRFLRPLETDQDEILSAAGRAWSNWQQPTLTAHDGIGIPQGNERLRTSVGRIHSATSLTLLIQSPLAFLWQYALGWKEPEWTDPFELTPQDFGTLLHTVLERTVTKLEQAGSFASATHEDISEAVTTAVQFVREHWENPPPRLLFERKLKEAHDYAVITLTWDLEPLAGQTSLAERKFGGPEEPVVISGTNIRFRGVIDRLDQSADGTVVRVIDYKTGGKRPGVTVENGQELQRVLYRFAVQSMLPDAKTVHAYLFNPRFPGFVPLSDELLSEQQVVEGIQAAISLLEHGQAVIGEDVSPYHFGRIALPVDPRQYVRWKQDSLAAALAPVRAAFGEDDAPGR